MARQVALYASIVAVASLSYLIFRLSATGAKWLSQIAIEIMVRIMGLLLAAVPIQFLTHELKE